MQRYPGPIACPTRKLIQQQYTNLFYFASIEIKLVDPLVTTPGHEHILLVILGVKHTAVVHLAIVQCGDDLYMTAQAQQKTEDEVQVLCGRCKPDNCLTYV